MEVYDDVHFTEDGNCIYGPRCRHCADETIQPFQILPNTKVILWDHQHCGLSQAVHLSQYRKPLVRIKNKIIGDGSRMVATAEQGISHLMAVGVLSYDTDSICGGLCVLLDQFQENGTDDQLTAPIIFAKNTSIPSTKEEQYYSDLKFISEQYHCHLPIDPNKFIKMRVKCLIKGLSCQIMVEMVSMATKFIATPIPPIPTVMTALSNRLTALSSRKEMQTGFIVMDKFRKLVLLLENDPKVFEFPIVGIWVTGVPSVVHPFVWISFLRYISCTQYSNRLCLPPQPFLLALYSSTCELPEYYDCITADGSQNLSYDLYNGCTVTSVHKFPALDIAATDIELSRVSDKTKWKYFINAESQLLNRRHVHNTAQNLIVSNTDDMPQIAPFPQPIRMIEARPLVPDLSLVESRNGTSFAPLVIEDRHCAYYKNNNYNEMVKVKETICPAAYVDCKSVYSNNEESNYISSEFISNATDSFEEQVNAAIPAMNNIRITDETGSQESAKSDFKSDPCIEFSDSHLCANTVLHPEVTLISHKQNSIPLATNANSNSKPSRQENVPIRSNSKTLTKRPTRIPKPKCKQTMKRTSPIPSKPGRIASNDCRSSDIQKAVLLASASTMTSIVWPSTSLETQGAGNDRRKIYVDEVLQTDELEFDKNHRYHTDRKTISKPVVECAATQTSICERRLNDDKEFHCVECCQPCICERKLDDDKEFHRVECCQCCINPCKCNVRRCCLRTSLEYTGSLCDDDDELQCETSGISSSIIENPCSDILKSCSSDFNSCEEDDCLFLGESVSTTRNQKQNMHEASLTDMRHKNKKKDSCETDHCDEEVYKLYNMIQGHLPCITVERTARDKPRSPPRTLFHSTSETTKKLNSYALKYIEPGELIDVAKLYHLDSVNDSKVNDVHYNRYTYGQKSTLPEEQNFKPSPLNVLSSHFSVATNKHLEKYVFS